ncbi:MAG TPA: hypothetical protein VN843_19760 [Anaerolineales bacterium]|nr:hypothetical protein [Anaerolineales bacterium]
MLSVANHTDTVKMKGHYLPLDLADKLIQKAKETPYFHLRDKDSGEIYMERYWLKQPDENGGNAIRVHHTMRSDFDRALHDHPWPSTSIILKGGFYEILPEDQKQDASLDANRYLRIWRGPGDVVSRSASDRHRLEIPDGQTCWSMFIVGEWEKDWGFYDKEEGFVYWRKYLDDWTTITASDKQTMCTT